MKKTEILSDEEFETFINQWIDNFSNELHMAGGDEAVLKLVIGKYIEDGFLKSMGPMEIWDYFSISSPGIIDNYNLLKIKRHEVEKIFREVMEIKVREWQ